MSYSAGGHFIGYVTSMSPLNKTGRGADVMNFTVESRSRSYDQNKEEWKDVPPVRVRCNVFGQMARNAHSSLEDGDRVVVIGKFRDAVGRLELDVDAMGLDFREHSLADDDGS